MYSPKKKRFHQKDCIFLCVHVSWFKVGDGTDPATAIVSLFSLVRIRYMSKIPKIFPPISIYIYRHFFYGKLRGNGKRPDVHSHNHIPVHFSIFLFFPFSFSLFGFFCFASSTAANIKKYWPKNSPIFLFQSFDIDQAAGLGWREAKSVAICPCFSSHCHSTDEAVTFSMMDRPVFHRVLISQGWDRSKVVHWKVYYYSPRRPAQSPGPVGKTLIPFSKWNH